MKIVFFGTANVALPILEKLHQQHQVLAAVTNPDAPVGRKKIMEESPVSALARDLKLKTFKPERVKNNPQFLQELRQLDADIFVVVAYGKILPPEVISLPPKQTVNVHFSALPKYRGPSPIQYALWNGETQTGTSIFILDEEVDHGPLLAQQIVNIDPDDNYFTLSDKLARVSADLLLATLSDYQAGRLTPLSQDHTAATYCKMISKQDGKIDWRKPAAEIYNQFRAFYPWPGIWTAYNGKKLKVLDCALSDVAGLDPVSLSHAGLAAAGGRVVCGHNTALQIKSLQPEGKSEMDISSFLNGYQGFIGSTLG
ncbi:MAG: methionyl-tRNA formyltransferase [Patescibacteria group bacterium]|nr:methionyl-tRNA formyltransferase [Patescibacteria group bacterium]